MEITQKTEGRWAVEDDDLTLAFFDSEIKAYAYMKEVILVDGLVNELVDATDLAIARYKFDYPVITGDQINKAVQSAFNE